MTAVERDLPTDEAHDLLALVQQVADERLRPQVEEFEEKGAFPRELFRELGRLGLLSLPYPIEYGGGGQPAAVYLQVVEELAAAWGAVGMGVSVHILACHPLAAFGTDAQRRRFLPDLLSGDLLGAYGLSESASGSDAAALRTRAVLDQDASTYTVTGTKAWITHGGVADCYALLVRTGTGGPQGISCLLVDAATPGVSAAAPERKMGFGSSPTAGLVLDAARVGADRLIGELGQGFSIAMSALDAGRLGIAACAVGIATAALEAASAYAQERWQFGRPILDFQGVSFLLADAATQVAAARELYLAAARRRDAGKSFSTQAAMAKLFATDTCMRVTTDAVQVLAGAGYVRDFPVERWFREAKALQIVEGTNQIQRVVIGRALARG
ncbi:MAG: acyl-CoA dehydrogenase family protein [Angustibacter sp.]